MNQAYHDRPNCPKCGSHDPALHPATSFEGEVHICSHEFHSKPTNRTKAKQVPALKRVIDGCAHGVTRMEEWIREGACPICLTATLGMRNDYITVLEGRLDIYPKLLDFYSKHALGPKMEPSCLVCGNACEKVAIRHLELPGIVVCQKCKDAVDHA